MTIVFYLFSNSFFWTFKASLDSTVDPAGHDGFDDSRGDADHGFRTAGLVGHVLFYIDSLKWLAYATLHTQRYAPLMVLIPYIPISVFPYLIVAVEVPIPYRPRAFWIQNTALFPHLYIIIIRVYAEVLRINVNKLASDVFRSGIRHATFHCLTVHGTVDHLQFLYLIVARSCADSFARHAHH